jgi:hypothetical protein
MEAVTTREYGARLLLDIVKNDSYQSTFYERNQLIQPKNRTRKKQTAPQGRCVPADRAPVYLGSTRRMVSARSSATNLAT